MDSTNASQSWQLQTIGDDSSPISNLNLTIPEQNSTYSSKSITTIEPGTLTTMLIKVKSSTMEERYDVKKRLGKGGGGEVFEVADKALKRDVALKCLPSDRIIDDKMKERFLHEARIIANLEHPGILPVYDLQHDDEGDIFFTMREANGTPLDTLIQRISKGDSPRALRTLNDKINVIIRLCEVVSYAHNHNVLHRDIKPSNIIVGDYGEVLLIDWGIALHKSEEAISSGKLVGTPLFMSPEQARCESSDERSDIYSIGITMFFLFTTKSPLHAKDTQAFWEKKKEGQLDPNITELLRDTIPKRLLAIMQKTFAVKAKDRYQSVTELIQDLKHYQQGLSISAYQEPLFHAILRTVRRHRKALIAGCTALILIFGTWFMFQHIAEQRKLKRVTSLINQSKASMRLFEENNDPKLKESSLAAAQKALLGAKAVEQDNTDISILLQIAFISHFRLALENRSWRQAEAKLLQAKEAGLSDETYDKHMFTLNTAEQARTKYIRERIKTIMDDAATGSYRTILYENAVAELISLKDPVAVESLKPYLKSESTDLLLIAVKVLGWMDDPSVVTDIRPIITSATSGTRQQPVSLLVAATTSLMRLAPSDIEVYREINNLFESKYLNDTKESIYEQVAIDFRVYSKHFLTTQMKHLAKKQNVTSQEWLSLIYEANRTGSITVTLECSNLAIERLPDDHMMYAKRSSIYLTLGNMEKAIEDAETAIRIRPTEPHGYDALANIYRHTRNLEKAVEIMQKGLALTPSASRYQESASLMHELGKSRIAEQQLSKALQLDPEFIPIYYSRALIRYELGEYDAALKDVNKFLSERPHNVSGLVKRATIRREMKDYANAIKDLDKAIMLNPKSAAAYTTRAKVKLAMNDSKGALVDYIQAVPLVNDERSLQELMDNMHKLINSPEELTEILDTWITENPDNYWFYYQRGIFYHQYNRFDKACDDLTRAITLNPELIKARTGRGIAYFKLGDYLEAAEDFKEILRHDPKSLTGRINLGLANIRLGLLDEALEQFNILLAEGVDDFSINHGLAVIHKTMGNEDGYQTHLRKAQKQRESEGYSRTQTKDMIDKLANIADKSRKAVKLLGKDLENADEYIQRAEYYNRLKKKAKAADDYLTALTSASVEQLRLYANDALDCALRCNPSRNPVPVLRRWVKLDPENPNSWIALAVALVDQPTVSEKQISEAVDIVSRLADKNQLSKPDHFLRTGWVFFRNKDFEKAEHYHRKAVKQADTPKDKIMYQQQLDMIIKTKNTYKSLNKDQLQPQ